MTGVCLALAYELRRDEYVVEMRAFENGSAGIAVRPRNLSGVDLELRSAQPFMDARHIGLGPDEWPFGSRYWTLPANLKGEPMQFTVIDASGRVLGAETVAYRQVLAVG
jgi:hypothetical protein